MYICPVCGKAFPAIQKHFLSCWKKQHPYHVSNPTPHSEDIIKSQVDDNVLDFFKGFQSNDN